MAEGNPITTLEAARARLAQEHDNCRAALRWSIDAGELETGLRLASTIWHFWYQRGYYSEGIAWLSELLAHPDGGKALPVRSDRSKAAAIARAMMR